MYLRARNAEETGGEQKALQRGLSVAEANAGHVENALRVGQRERVQSQNAEHLLRRDQRAAALLYQLAHARHATQARSERRRH